MKAVIQRVKSSRVSINGNIHSEIQQGMLILLGIGHQDDITDIEWLCKKIVDMRIFDDENGVMNLNIKTIDGDCLVISQFTLFASTKKGNRPSYVRAAPPAVAEPLYEKFLKTLSILLGKKVKSGVFGADMKVELLNDGPVTILIDTKIKE